MFCLSVFLFLFLFLLDISWSMNRTDDMRLRKYILSNESFAYHPTSQDFNVLSLHTDFWPSSIIDLDQSKQIFTIVGTISISWKDPDLTWNPSEFGGLSKLILANEPPPIWTPSFVVVNSAKQMSATTIKNTYICSEGTVVYRVTDVFQMLCPIRITLYPFDTQDCAIVLSTVADSYKFTSSSPSLKLIHDNEWFTENNEWMLTDSYALIRNTRYVDGGIVEFHFKLERHARFYILTIIFPMCLLSVLNSFAFLMPVECGEKMSYLVAIMLSYSMYLGFVNDIMPKSDELSRMAIYLTLVVSQSCLSIVFNIYIVYTHFRKSNQKHIGHDGSLCKTVRIDPKVDQMKGQKNDPSNIKRVCFSGTCLLFMIFFILALLNVLVFFV